MARGNRRQDIVRDDADRDRLVEHLGRAAIRYVGPLEQEGFERTLGLIDDKYRVQQFRNMTSLRADPTATADDPQGY